MLTIPSIPVPAALLADGAAAGGSAFGGLLPIVLMFAVIYFIVLRPMSKQEKDRKKRVEGLKKGDQVVLQGGILGRITNADDPKIAVVELAERVRVRVLKSKIEDLQDTVLKADKEQPAAKKDDKDDKAAAKKDDKAAKAFGAAGDDPGGPPKKADAEPEGDDARKGA
jgi:preprotein translocase subunit YajC